MAPDEKVQRAEPKQDAYGECAKTEQAAHQDGASEGNSEGASNYLTSNGNCAGHTHKRQQLLALEMLLLLLLWLLLLRSIRWPCDRCDEPSRS